MFDDLTAPTLSQDYTAQALPAPPPSIKAAKGPSIWDKQHISDTLMAIGTGLLSGHNFGDGLAAAGQGILGQQQALRAQQLKSTSYGGPDDEFAITTDTNGNRSIARVPEFAKANADKREAAFRLKTAMSPKDRADLTGRALHAISSLPQEQQSAAYADLKSNPTRYGLPDSTDLPDDWTNAYGAVGGAMGTSVYQAQTLDQKAADAQAKSALDQQKLAQGNRRLAQGDARIAQGAERLLKTPPKGVTSKPRSGTLKIGTQMGGYTYMGGDPHNKASWK